MKKFFITFFILMLFFSAFLITSRFISLFVIQPIGAIPKGAVLIVWRGENMQFIDSADAVCKRTIGGVNLLCRGLILGKIAENRIATLPYSKTLYLWSTDGAEYDK